MAYIHHQKNTKCIGHSSCLHGSFGVSFSSVWATATIERISEMTRSRSTRPTGDPGEKTCVAIGLKSGFQTDVFRPCPKCGWKDQSRSSSRQESGGESPQVGDLFRQSSLLVLQEYFLEAVGWLALGLRLCADQEMDSR